MEVYPLMICCNGFYVGDASWSGHREKFPGSSMTGFWRSCFRRMLRKEEVLNNFFYLDFDLAILEGRRACHEQSRWDRGESLSSGL